MITGLHIETTNKCTLKCPQCSRTKFIEQFPKAWTNQDLDLEAFKKFFDIEGLKVWLCGNYGDPIYYPDLFDLIKFVKSKNCTVAISTNGSYQKESWWHELGSLLDEQDKVVFAIDGTPDNFTEYRINAEWESILTGIQTLAPYSVKLGWQYIRFKYNENSIEQAKQLSQELGVDDFFVIDSARFDNENDPLIPSIGRDNISAKKVLWKQNKITEIDPVCKQEPTYHYISASGQYSPCCWSAEHRFYYKSLFWKNKDIYNIKQTTLSQILLHKQTVDFYSSLEKTKPEYCTFNCPKG